MLNQHKILRGFTADFIASKEIFHIQDSIFLGQS